MWDRAPRTTAFTSVPEIDSYDNVNIHVKWIAGDFS